MAWDIFTVLLVSFSTLVLLRKIAIKINLVDKPNHRKLHDGAIPLVGGLSISITLIYFVTTNSHLFEHQGLFACLIAMLALVGGLDDKYDLSARSRLLVQSIVSLLMIYIADLQLNNLGDILGMGDITLGWMSTPVTLLAVLAAINAFNMVDGIDGLLGGLSVVTFCSMAILLSLNGYYDLAYLCIICVAVLVPYLALNLGWLGKKRKVFMGDAGSMVIGFIVIWFALHFSQQESSEIIRPVTVLWIIAVPLTDMIAIMLRRIKDGRSPLKPDREHLHHLFQREGLTSRQTLTLICVIATTYAMVGIYGEVYKIAESVMFWTFIGAFTIYLHSLNHTWRLAEVMKKMKLTNEV